MTTLFDIIETLHIESQQIDSIFRNKSRYLMARYAKEGMKKLNLTFGLGLKGFNLFVPSSCVVYKPEGFERFVRAYVINCDGKTIELKRNNKIPEEIFTYLVNCDGSLLTDCDNTPMTTECMACNESQEDGCYSAECTVCHGTGYCMTELELFMADLATYKNSWIKENADHFEFSSDLEGIAVVIEYISNQTVGVEECAIRVDEKCALALEYYIKFRLLEGGEQTVQNAQYYKQMFKNAREAEVIRQNALTKSDLYSILTMR